MYKGLSSSTLAPSSPSISSSIHETKAPITDSKNIVSSKQIILFLDLDLTILKYSSGGLPWCTYDTKLLSDDPEIYKTVITHYDELKTLLAERPNIIPVIITKGDNKARAMRVLEVLNVPPIKRYVWAFDADRLDKHLMSESAFKLANEQFKTACGTHRWKDEILLTNLSEQLKTLRIDILEFQNLAKQWTSSFPTLEIGKMLHMLLALLHLQKNDPSLVIEQMFFCDDDKENLESAAQFLTFIEKYRDTILCLNTLTNDFLKSDITTIPVTLIFSRRKTRKNLTNIAELAEINFFNELSDALEMNDAIITDNTPKRSRTTNITTTNSTTTEEETKTVRPSHPIPASFEPIEPQLPVEPQSFHRPKAVRSLTNAFNAEHATITPVQTNYEAKMKSPPELYKTQAIALKAITQMLVFHSKCTPIEPLPTRHHSSCSSSRGALRSLIFDNRANGLTAIEDNITNNQPSLVASL